MDKQKLYDAQGKEIKTNSVPAVHWKNFVMPVRAMQKEDRVDPKGSVSPAEVIRELRAGYIEMQDRFTLLATGLAIVAKENPGGEMDRYLSQIGLTLVDMKGQSIYQPSKEYQVAPESQGSPQENSKG